MRRGSTALASLRPPEAAQVLAWLVDKHPELATEAEKLAAEAVAPQPSDQIQASVSKRLGRLDMDDLAELAGMHRGEYVQPWTAAGELIDGIVVPYLEDVRRLAGLGQAADVPAQRTAAAAKARSLESWLEGLSRDDLFTLVREQVRQDPGSAPPTGATGRCRWAGPGRCPGSGA